MTGSPTWWPRRTLALRHYFTDRDPAALTERLRADLDVLLTECTALDPMATFTWLGDSRVPLSGVLAHLVNELQIHGRDIARATRMPWEIPPREAAYFFEAFFVELLRHGVGRLLDNDEPPRDRRIAVGFSSDHTIPVTLNQMLFHRISKPRAVLTGKIAIRGRRPWKLAPFLRTVRCP